MNSRSDLISVLVSLGAVLSWGCLFPTQAVQTPANITTPVIGQSLVVTH